ncbi:MAG: hypothetical protein WBN55_03740 [Eudoraea sp.]|uniref:hypothetical protein n=1 Tax=Eudoraea sp. TaxID=1979955 RepID=UPI003C77A4AB
MKICNNLYFNFVMMLVCLISLSIVFQSCKRTSEKTSEKIIEKSLGDDAEVDIDDEKVVIKTDEGTFTTDATMNSWPKEAPSEVPEFKYGDVIGVTTQEVDEAKNWVVIFENVPANALQEYKETLESEGFKINFTTTAGTGGHLAAEKGKIAIMLMAGEGNATVTIGFNN